MASIFKRSGSPIWHLKFRDGLTADKKPRYRMVSARTEDEEQARAVLAEVTARDKALAPPSPPPPMEGSVAAFAERWIENRRAGNLDWQNDRSRLKHHILPVIGHLPIAEVRRKHILEIVNRARISKLAQRTVYNVYSVASALFRDAQRQERVEQTPCTLDERDLGPIVDKDPERRAAGLFTRREAQTIISTHKIPPDRQMVYGLELLAGVRPGEASALRWRDYDPTVRPLGRLAVSRAYSTRQHRARVTKTRVARHVPVHPTLAAMLAHWKLHGWAAMMGRAPKAEDLIVPLPPEHAARRRTRTGEAFRGHDYSGKLWRDVDLPALGWRHRQNFDMLASFITLALEDGASPDVIRDRVTHTPRHSVFQGFVRGEPWAATCREILKLRLSRRKNRKKPNKP